MQQVLEQGDCLQLNQKLFGNNGLNRGLGPGLDSFFIAFFITHSNCDHKCTKLGILKTNNSNSINCLHQR